MGSFRGTCVYEYIQLCKALWALGVRGLGHFRIGPKAPCSQIVYSCAQCSYTGTPLVFDPKPHMDPGEVLKGIG